jgi:5'-methylthioadenosine phosphorylase
MATSDRAKAMVEAFALALPESREASPIDTTLDSAIVTPPESRDPALLAKLDSICGRALGR